MPQCKRVKVISNDEICTGIYSLKIEKDRDSLIKPGQFYMLRCWKAEPILWRPISICEVGEDSLTFLYAVVGRGTEMISAVKEGEEIEAMGPLGNGFDIDKVKGKVALVAGGIGIAPMVEISKRLRSEIVDVYAGFRNNVYSIENIRPFVNDINISTEDGSKGYKGYVTDIFDASKYDIVLCCGPEIMMNKVVKLCRSSGTKVYISMEKHMACGVGACLVCTCKTKDGNKRSCKDGPVFDGDEIIIN